MNSFSGLLVQGRRLVSSASSTGLLFVTLAIGACGGAEDGGGAGGGQGQSGATGTGGVSGGAGLAGGAGTPGTSGSSGSIGTSGAPGAGSTGMPGGSGGAPSAAGTAGQATGGTTTTGGTTAGGAPSGGTATGGTGTAGAPPTGRPTEVWVSPNGNDANPGTQALPVKTICDTVLKMGACYKICPSSYSCPPTGATIWVMGGTHRLTAKIDIGGTRPGVANGIMKLYAVAGARPVLDAGGLPAGTIALHVKGSYWHVRGLEIANAPSNCVKVEGGFTTIEDTVVHHCGNTGITLGRYAGEDMVASPGSNNTVLNCDSHSNIGPDGDGEDADGFGAKESAGTNNVFRGCRAWNNADDGYDFYGWANPITVEDSWAFESNRVGTDAGDGNGFKLGIGNGNHVLRNCIAAYNTKRGYTSNGASGQSTCTNCRGCNNTEGLNDTGSRAVLGSVTTMSPCPDLNRAKGARGANGALPAL